MKVIFEPRKDFGGMDAYYAMKDNLVIGREYEVEEENEGKYVLGDCEWMHYVDDFKIVQPSSPVPKTPLQLLHEDRAYLGVMMTRIGRINGHDHACTNAWNKIRLAKDEVDTLIKLMEGEQKQS